MLAPAGCGAPHPPAPPRSGEVVVGLEAAPGHLDPRVATDAAADRLFELILDGLVTKRPSGELVPDLATRWEVLEGGRRYRFHLRSGVTFHDGRPLTARDVVWSYQTMIDGTVPTPKRAAFAPVEEVVAVDDLTVDFRLAQPWPSLLVNLLPGQGVIPAGMTPRQMRQHPVGTGPFRVVSHQPDRLVLAAWPAAWRGPPKVSQVIFKVVPDRTVLALELLRGSVQLVVNGLAPDVIPLFLQRPGFRVVMTPGIDYAYLGLNLEDPILADRRVRRALAMGIDRQRLVDTLWRGTGVVTDSLLPPHHWARLDPIPEAPTYDPDGARTLLDATGYPDPDGPGGKPRLSLTYKTSTSETYLLQAQVIQAMLAQIGVEIEIRSFEFATLYSDIKRGSFQMFSLVWTGIVDPDIYSYVLHSRSVPPAGANRGRYRSPELDRLVDEASHTVDRERRRKLYHRVQRIFARDLPYISLFTKANVAVLAAGLEGWESYPGGELYALRDVWWRSGP